MWPQPICGRSLIRRWKAGFCPEEITEAIEQFRTAQMEQKETADSSETPKDETKTQEANAPSQTEVSEPESSPEPVKPEEKPQTDIAESAGQNPLQGFLINDNDIAVYAQPSEESGIAGYLKPGPAVLQHRREGWFSAHLRRRQRGRSQRQTLWICQSRGTAPSEPTGIRQLGAA